MKKRFVIGAALSADDKKKFLAHLESINAAWWHYIPNFWLVWTRDSDLTAGDIRDLIGDSSGNPNCIVMQIEEDLDWASRGNQKNAKGGPWTEWLSRSWGVED